VSGGAAILNGFRGIAAVCLSRNSERPPLATGRASGGRIHAL